MRIHAAGNPNGYPSFSGRIRCGSGRIRSKLVQSSNTKTQWVSLILGVRIRCGSGRIRWDPLRQAAPKHIGYPSFWGCGSDADPGGSGGIRGGQKRASAGGSLMQMDVGPTRIRADPVGSAESGGASQRWGCTVLAMQKNAWL